MAEQTPIKNEDALTCIKCYTPICYSGEKYKTAHLVYGGIIENSPNIQACLWEWACRNCGMILREFADVAVRSHGGPVISVDKPTEELTPELTKSSS